MKKFRPTAKIKYCHSCGTKMIAIWCGTTYDNDSGKPDYLVRYECPNNRGKWFWDKHEEFPDYGMY